MRGSSGEEALNAKPIENRQARTTTGRGILWGIPAPVYARPHSHYGPGHGRTRTCVEVAGTPRRRAWNSELCGSVVPANAVGSPLLGCTRWRGGRHGGLSRPLLRAPVIP